MPACLNASGESKWNLIWTEGGNTKILLIRPGRQGKITVWRGREVGLKAGTEIQSQKLPALPGAHRRNLRRPRKTLESNEQIPPKNTCLLQLELQTRRVQNSKNLEWQGLIKDLSTCMISWTALQASSLLAAMVTSVLAAGRRARTTRAGKSVL